MPIRVWELTTQIILPKDVVSAGAREVTVKAGDHGSRIAESSSGEGGNPVPGFFMEELYAV